MSRSPQPALGFTLIAHADTGSRGAFQNWIMSLVSWRLSGLPVKSKFSPRTTKPYMIGLLPHLWAISHLGATRTHWSSSSFSGSVSSLLPQAFVGTAPSACRSPCGRLLRTEALSQKSTRPEGLPWAANQILHFPSSLGTSCYLFLHVFMSMPIICHMGTHKKVGTLCGNSS